MGASTDSGSLMAGFPGQGVQFPGMGRRLAESSDAARGTFERASAHLGLDVLDLFADPERIHDLEVAGVATLVCSVAASEAALEEGMNPGIVVGHSLGEYAALVCADALSLEDALDLVGVRARETAAAATQAPGAMSALTGVGWEQASQMCAEIPQVWVANDNHPEQVVVSGVIGSLEILEDKARTAGARVRRLAVAGAFHCPLMAPAVSPLAAALAGVEVRAPARVVVSSTTATVVEDPQRISQLLLDQLTGPVRFTETIAQAWVLGARRLVECGPKPVLAGLVKRMPQDWAITGVSDAAPARA